MVPARLCILMGLFGWSLALAPEQIIGNGDRALEVNEKLTSNLTAMGDVVQEELKILINEKNEIKAEAFGIGYHAKFGSTEDDGYSKIYVAETGMNIFTMESSHTTNMWLFFDGLPLVVNGSNSERKMVQHLSEAFNENIDALLANGHDDRIVKLSEAVGTAGMDGKSHPMTLWLHQLASSFDSHTGIQSNTDEALGSFDSVLAGKRNTCKN
eukprot:jgi/Bigna1/80399/fgenesh1_pg.70_\